MRPAGGVGDLLKFALGWWFLAARHGVDWMLLTGLENTFWGFHGGNDQECMVILVQGPSANLWPMGKLRMAIYM